MGFFCRKKHEPDPPTRIGRLSLNVRPGELMEPLAKIKWRYMTRSDWLKLPCAESNYPSMGLCVRSIKRLDWNLTHEEAIQNMPRLGGYEINRRKNRVGKTRTCSVINKYELCCVSLTIGMPKVSFGVRIYCKRIVWQRKWNKFTRPLLSKSFTTGFEGVYCDRNKETRCQQLCPSFVENI